MIEINILRKRLERFHRRRVLTKIIIFYFGGLFLILLILGGVYLSNKLIILQDKENMDKLRADIRKDEELVEMVKKFHDECDVLCKNMSLYKDEINSRVVWYDKLSLISNCLPPGMYLNRISFKESGSQEKKKVIIIDGYVSPIVENPRKTLSSFVQNIKRDGGSLIDKITLTQINNVKTEEEVVYFVFECSLK
ncbi:MAG TPA: hypothetical protein P5150_09730 [Candidatus Ratteibacteria bacterium]|nr:hypothetical protein [Candidatus Ratteibacteria bacterium]